jgi:hypothetical protein
MRKSVKIKQSVTIGAAAVHNVWTTKLSAGFSVLNFALSGIPNAAAASRMKALLWTY